MKKIIIEYKGDEFQERFGLMKSKAGDEFECYTIENIKLTHGKIVKQEKFQYRITNLKDFPYSFKDFRYIFAKYTKEQYKKREEKEYGKGIGIEYFENGIKKDDFTSYKEANEKTGLNTFEIKKNCLGIIKFPDKEFRIKNSPFKRRLIGKFFEMDIIQQIKKFGGEVVAEYNGYKEASMNTNINQTAIFRCLKGERKTAGNFIWRIKEKNNLIQI